MTDIVFIDPCSQENRANSGIAYLVSAVKKNGIKCKVFDLNSFNITDEQLLKNILQIKPKFSCFSVKSAVSTKTINLIKKLNKIINTIFVVGGPHITVDGGNFIKNTGLTNIFGLKSEAENSLVKLLSADISNKNSLKNIEGLIYFEDSRIISNPVILEKNIDKFAFPDFSFFYPEMASKSPYQLITSRGCPYLCSFCCAPVVAGRAIRFRTPENVVSEIERAIADYKIKSIEIQDDNFSFDIARAEEICRLLIKKNIKIQWNCASGVRADKLNENLIKLMKQSGCFSVSIGIESADFRTLKLNKKNETLLTIENTVNILKKYGIRVYGFFIIGLMGSVFKTEMKSLEFLKNSKLDDGFFNVAVPYPGTELYDYVHKNNFFISNYENNPQIGDDADIVFDTPDFKREERLKFKIFTDYIRKNREFLDLLTARRIELKLLKHKFDSILIIGINDLPSVLFSVFKLSAEIRVVLFANAASKNDGFIDNKIINKILYFKTSLLEFLKALKKVLSVKFSAIIFVDRGNMLYKVLFKFLKVVARRPAVYIPQIKKAQTKKPINKPLYKFPDITKNFYWAVYITLRCDFKCGYCVQKYNLTQHNLKKFSFTDELPAEKWIRFFENIAPKNIPLNILGGEPSLHPGFLDIILNIPGFIVCVNTNLNFDITPLIKKLHLAKSPIRIYASFHPDFTDTDKFIEKCLELKKIGIMRDILINVPAGGLELVNYPRYKKSISDYTAYFEERGLLLKHQETRGVFYGQLNREEDSESFGKKETKTVNCLSKLVAIAPDGKIFNCNAKLFAGLNDYYGDIINIKNIQFPKLFTRCSNYGKCDPCGGREWSEIKLI